MKQSGTVYLVGAGPGDPELITMKGHRLLQSADVIVHDALLDKRLLEKCKGAEIIDVGKRAGLHAFKQEEINEILYQKALQSNTVVRLKGGDPFLFGRGAEEARYLKDRGVMVKVVPGVSSAIAVPELCGIPITHREYASHVTIVTGHEMAGRTEERLDWELMAKMNGTIVILMGMSNHERLSTMLLNGGLPGGTPVAVIVQGSSSDQRSVLTDLAGLSASIVKEGLKAPGIIVVGKCAAMMLELGDLR